LAPLLPGADRVAYVDIDDTVKATHRYAKQGTVNFPFTGPLFHRRAPAKSFSRS
jgi:hypothetical protein